MQSQRLPLLWLILAISAIGLLMALANQVPDASHVYSVRSRPHPAPPFTFPDGGQRLFPDYRLVALYGTPDMPALGVLGEQSVSASITRVQDLASKYQPYSQQHILPSLEIITTIASATPTDNGNYSTEQDISVLSHWVQAARQAGVYVVLDLQPGRSDFLTQAKQYESLLKEPNVGLALDPEWRLKPNEIPLEQIGSVDVTEINNVISWLADLAQKNKLPQKLFLLHQFRLSMINNRSQLDTSHSNLAYAIQMDGQGTQQQKLDTWQAITADAPSHVVFGWKNFYRQDSPLLTPDQTMALTPQPWYVSYQ